MSDTDEHWETIEEYPDYKFSSLGRVQSKVKKDFWLMMKLTPHPDGYIQKGFYVDGVCRQRYVHRMVWQAFNGYIPEELEIDHDNKKRYDNRLCNLRLATRSQNLQNTNTGLPASGIRGVSLVKKDGKLSVKQRKALNTMYKRFEKRVDNILKIGSGK